MTLIIADLKAKLAVVTAAVKTSKESANTSRIAKAKAKAQERLAEKAKNEAVAKERKFLLDTLAGTKEEKTVRLDEIEKSMAVLEELYKLREELERAKVDAYKAEPADRDQLIATVESGLVEVNAEIATIEGDSDTTRLTYIRWLERETEERPTRGLLLEEVDANLNKEKPAEGLLREIKGDEAREIAEEGKQAKAQGRNSERYYITVRLKSRGSVPQGQQEPDDHFRFITAGAGYQDRTADGGYKRLLYHTMRYLNDAVQDARKAEWSVRQDIKHHSHLTIAEGAAGKTGQAWAEVTKEDPWRPTKWDGEKLVPMTNPDGSPRLNFGPVVLEFVPNQNPKLGTLRVLNVTSGMYHALRAAGAWNDDGTPREFTFFTGDNPRTGKPSNFAGLKAANGDVDVLMSPAKYGRLRAILCLAGGLKATEKSESEGKAEEPLSPEAAGEFAPPGAKLDSGTKTKRGERADGTRAGEPRQSKKGRKSGRPQSEDETPDLSRVSTLADGQAAVGDGPSVED
jgi:hypothetical protein